jgi:hypothetical protein
MGRRAGLDPALLDIRRAIPASRANQNVACRAPADQQRLLRLPYNISILSGSEPGLIIYCYLSSHGDYMLQEGLKVSGAWWWRDRYFACLYCAVLSWDSSVARFDVVGGQSEENGLSLRRS